MAKYDVYLADYTGITAFHLMIFIDTNETADGKLGGRVYHVMGDVNAPMRYETGIARKPWESESFGQRIFIGKVDAVDLDKVHQVCSANPPPTPRYYQGVRIERDCRHWAHECVKMLKDQEIVLAT